MSRAPVLQCGRAYDGLETSYISVRLEQHRNKVKNTDLTLITFRFVMNTGPQPNVEFRSRVGVLEMSPPELEHTQ